MLKGGLMGRPVKKIMLLTVPAAEDALRAGPDADPPLNMHRASIFNGVFIFVTSALVLLLKGRQRRRQADETQGREQGPPSV